MAEHRIPASALSVISQPLIFVKRDIISYMNAAAIEFGGGDLTGKAASVLFPSYILDHKNGSFAATAFVGKKSCTVNVYSHDTETVFALLPKPDTDAAEPTVFASLRTTLANLKMSGSCISRLAEMKHDELLRGYAASVNRCYYRIKRCIDNLSLIELIRHGEYPFYAESTDLSEFYAKLIDSIRILLDKDLKIEFTAPEHLYISIDRYLAELAMLNLISNSLKHCGDKGRISISLMRTDKNTIIAVNDTGEGISPEILPLLFNRQLRSTELCSAAEGTGLGFATVRSIAELHDGALIVESRGTGKGTSVRLMLSNFVQPSSSLRSGGSIYGSGGLSGILQELTDSLPDDCYTSMTDD